MGRKQKRDKIFGGAQLQMLAGKDAVVTFKDIAGVDQVCLYLQWETMLLLFLGAKDAVVTFKDIAGVDQAGG